VSWFSYDSHCIGDPDCARSERRIAELIALETAKLYKKDEKMEEDKTLTD